MRRSIDVCVVSGVAMVVFLFGNLSARDGARENARAISVRDSIAADRTSTSAQHARRPRCLPN